MGNRNPQSTHDKNSQCSHVVAYTSRGRHQLKGNGITSDWRELLRIMNTQKCVTTTVTNDKKQCISVRKCSKPETKVAMLYDALKMKHAPFMQKKTILPKTGQQEQKENQKNEMLKDTS